MTIKYNSMILNKTEQNIGLIISFFATILLLIYLVFPFVEIGNPNQMAIAFGAIFILVVLLFILVVRKVRKNNEHILINYLNIGTQRYILGIFMVFYGLPKLLGTFFDYQLSSMDNKMMNVSDFELAWYFYGKKKWFEVFSGIMEFIPGLLLIPKRTYYKAALILLPVTSQVFILNLFYKIGGITFPAASILLACNLYIIYSQKNKILEFFKSLKFDLSIQLNNKTKLIIKILRIVGISLIVLVLFIKLKPAIFKSNYQEKYATLIGAYTLESMNKNGITYIPSDSSTYYKDLYIEKQERWNILRMYNNKTKAFVLNLKPENDSFQLYINNGGSGDEPDIIDSTTVLAGKYKLQNEYLLIEGIQLNDTLELKYKKLSSPAPKEWFW